MKTQTTNNLKDTITNGTLLAALLIALVGGIANSRHAQAQQVEMPTLTMDAIVVTAQRDTVQHLEPIIVTAKR